MKRLSDPVLPIVARVSSITGATGEGQNPRDPLNDRRQLLSRARLGIDRVLKPGDMAIAFSGGGIRSATISLGITQALAQENRLLDFDYCSTVSGGGYFGSFLTSLFLPDWARGPNATAAVPEGTNELRELIAKKKIAFDALSAKARSINLDNPGGVKDLKIRNPIWWLREHSRYLAPNGTSDYLLAAVYMVRNWLAMIYVVALPIALASLALILFDSWIFSGSSFISTNLIELGRWLHSPAWLVVFLLAFVSATAATAFWSSEAMSARSSAPAGSSHLKQWLRQRATPRVAMTAVALLSLAIIPLLLLLIAPVRNWANLYQNFSDHSLIEKAVAVGCALLALSSSFGFIVLNTTWGDFEGDALVAEVRRRLTRWNAYFVTAMLIVAALTIVDSIAIWAYHKLITTTFAAVSSAGFIASIVPIIAWLINRAQEWGKKSDSLVFQLIGQFVWTIALLAGVIMFSVLAVGVHIFVQSLVFNGQSWIAGNGHLGSSFVIVLIILGVLTLLTGFSTGFINLSSLHGIYAARLTRAYLGGTNLKRLESVRGTSSKSPSSITDSDPHDQIPVDVYQQARHLGPLHLINVTLNETRSPEGSQLLERDRKGVPLVFAPEGVFVNAARERPPRQKAIPKRWDELAKADVEKLSVGQLCAISGAAASTAMGSQTTLGGALALSFANIRLGYWWNAKSLFRTVPTFHNNALSWLYQRVTRPLRTFFYISNELIANYTRANARLNLSDGGHFDNSGAYELLRRDVKGIVVCDNGADPNYHFGDLEVLTRKARIDLGLAIEVASPKSVEKVMGKMALPLFLNGTEGDWRTRAASRRDQSGPSSPEDQAHCLLLDVFSTSKRNEVASRILWIKPRLFAGLPEDVVGYAVAHPDFPNESTGDQFFDEAQWESYRALGFSMMSALLAGPMGDRNALRKLVKRTPDEVKQPLQARQSATASPSGATDPIATAAAVTKRRSTTGARHVTE